MAGLGLQFGSRAFTGLWVLFPFWTVCFIVWGCWGKESQRGSGYIMSSPGWIQIHNSLASDPQVLALQACTTIPNTDKWFDFGVFLFLFYVHWWFACMPVLGYQILGVTNSCEPPYEDAEHWILFFSVGITAKPTLHTPFFMENYIGRGNSWWSGVLVWNHSLQRKNKNLSTVFDFTH